MAKKKVEIKCSCCGKTKELTREFYKTVSPLYKDNDGRFTICKSCMEERYNNMLKDYDGSSIDAFRHLCMNFDIYFDMETYTEITSKNEGNNFIGEYLGACVRRKNLRDKTSRNNSLASTGSKDVALDDGIIDQKLVDFWGEGYNAKEYVKLEKKYKKYTKHYPSESLQEQEIIRSLCELEVMRENCRKNGKASEYDKITTQIRKSMDDLNILPSKMKKYDEDDAITPGQLIYKIETKEPIPDKHPEFDDVDKVKWWVDRYLARPLRLLFGMEEGDLTYEDVKDDKYENNKNKR